MAPLDDSPHIRRFAWVLAVVALLIVLAVTPPLLNVSRLQRRIAASMSASLGRPVHLDNVRLHLLPVPGFTMENLVVSEDPAFGNEPVIRANAVDIRLRPSSLWRRQVEISSIHFKVDENGSGPSLNLVRNAAGQWNIQGLLQSAAGVPVAPTAQPNSEHGQDAAPRFPYIEATGARINIKLGDEKTPYSLTEADFALWLPNPARWQVRLEGRPARTDTNIADPGTLKLEGSLSRDLAASEDAGATQPAVDITAHWEHAPLGEASKLATGLDMGWRGKIAVDATLHGSLTAPRLTAKVHLEDLRRADFVPPRRLEIDVTCAGILMPVTGTITEAGCTLPTPAGSGGPGKIELEADALPATASALTFTNVDDAWLLDWARLFSKRVPADERPSGVLSGTLMLDATGRPETGALTTAITGLLPGSKAEAPETWPLTISTDGKGGLKLAPVVLVSDATSPALTLSGGLTASGYSFQISGNASAEEQAPLLAMAPPLGDGSGFGQPGDGGGSTAGSGAAVSCSRPWGGPQSCVPLAPVVAPRPAKRRR